MNNIDIEKVIDKVFDSIENNKKIIISTSVLNSLITVSFYATDCYFSEDFITIVSQDDIYELCIYDMVYDEESSTVSITNGDDDVIISL